MLGFILYHDTILFGILRLDLGIWEHNSIVLVI